METPSFQKHVAVINGMKYDSGKAELIGFNNEGDISMDEKFLFRTANNRYFLQKENVFNETVSIQTLDFWRAVEIWNSFENCNKLTLGRAFPGLRTKPA